MHIHKSHSWSCLVSFLFRITYIKRSRGFHQAFPWGMTEMAPPLRTDQRIDLGIPGPSNHHAVLPVISPWEITGSGKAMESCTHLECSGSCSGSRSVLWIESD